MLGHTDSRLGPRLPQELLDIIVSNLDGHPATLARCALVSSRLYQLSEKLLYRRFTLGPPVRYDHRSPTKTRPNLQSTHNLFLLLSKKPYLADYIEELTITNRGPLFTWLDRSATDWMCNSHADTIGKVMFSLTNLRRLSLIGVVSQASDDGYLDWLEFSGTFRYTMFYALAKLEKLEVVRLEHVDNVPLALFDRLPSGMKELILHGVAWAPDGYDPPEGLLKESLLSIEGKRFQKRTTGTESAWKPCQLETLCLHLHDSCYWPFASYLFSSPAAPQLGRLRRLHCGMREPEDHQQIWQLVSKCQETLERFEFFPAWPVSHEETMIDHIDFSALLNLRYIYFNFFIQADSWGADDWAPWVARTMNKLSYPMIPSTRFPSTPLSVSPSSSFGSSSSSSSSSSTSLASSELSLTAPNRLPLHQPGPNRIESIRIRLEFGFTECDDLYLNLSHWRSVDNVLAFRDDFPSLKEVRVDVVCVDDGTRPYLDSLLVEIKAQFPKLTKRGIVHVAEGHFLAAWCSSECLEA
ncbi:hypothetical protein NP233_g2447 [Leucocoprinus birnbaumii]|uniref:F-box domain-containing protein n=1 Tax=Leucocoprinus birnbaumii TaxID=56174 RepID=A0AAD5YYT8_9AGAR|nr:hypothetical protein NP233_g2447 [Leucocoprinus birnbaumii]